jgi:two-component system chemotaxis response regulator CheY
MKALIVDDCPLTREMIGLAISTTADVEYAENGEAAIRLVSEAVGRGAHYDLICLDITMPVMGGQEALRKIRAIEADSGAVRAKVFMITASSSPDDMIEAITGGECDDYLTKPVIRNVFLELLRKHSLLS